ncbi:MAG TPA: NAD(P)H-hydrate dehydratase [Gammaproteobacteria bacterium]|nr:NAD(P)H-hydrate dehydratase [Gammaproteobacteria bacterium]
MTANTLTSGGIPLYRAAQMRELDRLAIEAAGIPGYTLMNRAAGAAWAALRSRWPQARTLVVLCGAGNNGGDGYVLARLARADGRSVRVLQLGDAERIRGDALTARVAWLEAGGSVEPFAAAVLADADLIVDALLGTGFAGRLDAHWIRVIDAVNAAAVPVMAMDIPSGLHADTGHVADTAVRAQLTVTFIGHKPGLYTGAGPAQCGAIVCTDLDIPGGVLQHVAPAAELRHGPPDGLLSTPRARTAHKGDFGHVLVIGGDHGMAGAARLAGEAALRTGAGLVSVATRPEHAAWISAGCPELMCHGVATARDLQPLLAKATVIVIGPGLGRSSWAQDLLACVLTTRQPRVVDADALNLLAQDPVVCAHSILTPHPGEAARLAGLDSRAVQVDRFAAAQAISARYGGVTVLKGAGSIVQAPGQLPVICAAGNPGMASGGMGDVLSGVLGALLAQGMGLPEAAVTGVCLHARAADHAARDGERGLIARDVIGALRAMIAACQE